MTSSTRRVAFAAAVLAAAATAGAAFAEGPVTDGKPFHVECDVSNRSQARVSGVGATDKTHAYKLKFLVDPGAKAVTSLLGWKVRDGNFAQSVYIDDVRVMSDQQIVFCTDTTHGCRPFDMTGATGGRRIGKFNPYVIDLKAGTIGFSHNFEIHGGGQVASERSNATGACRVTPA